MQRMDIRVLTYQVRDVWLAQGLEHDILARSRSTGVAAAFDRAVAANIAVNRELRRDGLDGVDPAPERFVEAYEAASSERNQG